MLPPVVIMFFAFLVLTNSQQGRMTSVLWPLYPILLSGMKELCEKASLIPGGISSTDSDYTN